MSEDDYVPGSIGAEMQRIAAEYDALVPGAGEAIRQDFRAIRDAALADVLRAHGLDHIAERIEEEGE